MSFNKAKALKTASKYVQQGKYQSAIEEYRQIAQADASDVTTLNTLGDLYVKVGQTSEAIHSFLHIAEHYRMSGFYLKAIAMLKKVSKLDPDNIDVALKLAALYAQQKLIVDARHQYLNVAERFVREGKTRDALQIYQKIADLDPENTSVQIKLAEAYLREGETAQAYESFLVAAGELRRQGKETDALQVYQRAIKTNPRGQAALSSLVNLYLQRHEAGEAVALLEGLLAENPGDPEILTLAARVHQSMDNLPAAEIAIIQMLETAPSRYQYALDLALSFIRKSDVVATLRVFDQIAPTLYEYREEEKAANLLCEAIAVDPNSLEALARLAKVYERTHEDHLLIETLNTTVNVGLRSGNETVAIAALRQLQKLEPDEMQHRRRLRELQGDQADAELGGSFDESANPWDAATPAVRSRTEGASEFENNYQAVASDDEPPTAEAQWGWANSSEQPFAAEDSTSSGYGGFAENDHGSAWGSSDFSATPPDVSALSVRDELESVDFYLNQGMLDVARYTLESIAAQHPNHPDVTEKFVQLTEAEAKTVANLFATVPAPATDEAESNLGMPDFTLSDAATYGFDQVPEVDAPQVFTPSLPTPDLFAVEAIPEPELFDAEALKPESLNYYSKSDLQTGSLLVDDGAFDIADEPEAAAIFIKNSATATTEVSTPAESDILVPTIHSAPVEPAKVNPAMDLFDGEEMDGLLDFIDELKADTNVVSATEDFETHYNLGLAYKEMDMFDEAIEEFQQAFKVIMNDLKHPHYVPCCSMLGFCFSQKGLPRLAIMWLKKGLDVPGLAEDIYQALRFDLAEAYAASGDFQAAHDVFSEVYAVDVQYRNVKTRLQEIAAQL